MKFKCTFFVSMAACPRDGTTRLWGCGTSSCLSVVPTCSAPVNACAVSPVSEEVKLGEREDETSELTLLGIF